MWPALLAERGDDVTVLQRRPASTGLREVLGDVADPAAVRAALGERPVDGVIHLAAKVDVVGAWRDFERVNVGGTRAVLAGAAAAEVPRVVHVSSPSVAHTGGSLVGAGAGPAVPAHARGSYARSKAAAELVALGSDRPGLQVTAVRPHLVWGPGDTQLVGRIQQRAASGRLPLLGPATALIDTTYVTNAAEAIVAALDRSDHAHGQALVVTNGEPRPVGEMIAAFCRAGGVPVPTRHVPPRVGWLAGALVEGALAVARALPRAPQPTEPPLTRFLAEQLSTAHWFDQRQTRAVLQWTPRVSIEAGLRTLAAHRQ